MDEADGGPGRNSALNQLKRARSGRLEDSFPSRQAWTPYRSSIARSQFWNSESVAPWEATSRRRKRSPVGSMP